MRGYVTQPIGGLGLASNAVTSSPNYWAQLQQFTSQVFAPPEGPKAPAPSELSRKTIVAVEPSDAIVTERTKLGEKAKKLLGYSVLSRQVTAEENKKRAKWEASKAFKKLGFDPLNEDKVKLYQDQMIRHLQHQQYWETTPLEKYTAPVPEFALSRAIELKQELPIARFEVQHLQYKPDPFLVMVVEDQRFYIDVWDEPMFEGRRTV